MGLKGLRVWALRHEDRGFGGICHREHADRGVGKRLNEFLLFIFKHYYLLVLSRSRQDTVMYLACLVYKYLDIAFTDGHTVI